jgi:hypothetical protein
MEGVPSSAHSLLSACFRDDIQISSFWFHLSDISGADVVLPIPARFGAES